jgi:hypothetical protein
MDDERIAVRRVSMRVRFAGPLSEIQLIQVPSAFQAVGTGEIVDERTLLLDVDTRATSESEAVGKVKDQVRGILSGLEFSEDQWSIEVGPSEAADS